MCKLLQLFLLAFLALASGADYDYKDALSQSMLFYEAQRSGKLPSDNRIPWRKDSALDDLIQGGYYDAGDHVKFGFPMAAMTTQLAWGGITFMNGYQAAGEVEHLKQCLKWSTDYFIAAHTGTNEFYGQVGDGSADHAYWGRPEDMTMERPAFKIDSSHPGSDLAGETAAALAAASIFYKNAGDDSLSTESLNHAKELFQLADEHRGVYTDSIPAGDYYNSWSGYQDELAWGALWLYKATNDDSYLQKAESFYNDFNLNYIPSEFSWDNKVAGVQILLYEATGKNEYASDIDNYINYMMNVVKYTPKGLLFINAWGSLKHAANVAHTCLQIAELGLHVDECRSLAETQINYILGDTGRSYVVGLGDNPPQRPHHRASSCPDMPAECGWDAFNSPDPNPQTLNGALVGGPDENDQYTDDRGDYAANEVATDYNAGYQGVLAYMSMA